MKGVLRIVLLIIAALLMISVIQHPSGTGNPACYPSLTCHHVTHIIRKH